VIKHCPNESEIKYLNRQIDARGWMAKKQVNLLTRIRGRYLIVLILKIGCSDPNHIKGVIEIE
jgi:hypothetical protein